MTWAGHGEKQYLYPHCHWLQGVPELTRQLHHSPMPEPYPVCLLPVIGCRAGGGSRDMCSGGPPLSLISSCIAGVQPPLKQASELPHELWSVGSGPYKKSIQSMKVAQPGQ